jgi:alkanesulfonate monooxygenase SsuD/methylene tetrahydromethanopterin reductase-like flavin-dependent oxidoreductase (luciferase family)
VEDALGELGAIPDAVFAQWFPDGGEWPRYVAGSPEAVRRQLTAMAEALSIDEIMAVTIVHDHAARVRSYELLAEAFDLRSEMMGSAERFV